MTAMHGRYNVLFLCTGNSARSIMAEAILNGKGGPVFTAYSAGSRPSGVVRPEALKLIEMADLPTEALRSKSWEEFAKPGAPKMNFVFTVCDSAAQEMCPVWPGHPYDRPLGRSRSRASNGYATANRTRFSRGVPASRTPDQFVP